MDPLQKQPHRGFRELYVSEILHNTILDILSDLLLLCGNALSKIPLCPLISQFSMKVVIILMYRKLGRIYMALILSGLLLEEYGRPCQEQQETQTLKIVKGPLLLSELLSAGINNVESLRRI